MWKERKEENPRRGTVNFRLVGGAMAGAHLGWDGTIAHITSFGVVQTGNGVFDKLEVDVECYWANSFSALLGCVISSFMAQIPVGRYGGPHIASRN